MRMPRADVYWALDTERDYQDEKWAGSASSEQPGTGSLDRSIDEFALYIVEYAAQLRHLAGTTAASGPKLDAVRKVGALAVACMEAHGAPLRLPSMS